MVVVVCGGVNESSGGALGARARMLNMFASVRVTVHQHPPPDLSPLFTRIFAKHDERT
jgi:hypothetical protein